MQNLLLKIEVKFNIFSRRGEGGGGGGAGRRGEKIDINAQDVSCQPKSKTYPHFRDLDNNQIEELPPEDFHNNSQLVVL